MDEVEPCCERNFLHNHNFVYNHGSTQKERSSEKERQIYVRIPQDWAQLRQRWNRFATKPYARWSLRGFHSLTYSMVRLAVDRYDWVVNGRECCEGRKGE